MCLCVHVQYCVYGIHPWFMECAATDDVLNVIGKLIIHYVMLIRKSTNYHTLPCACLFKLMYRMNCPYIHVGLPAVCIVVLSFPLRKGAALFPFHALSMPLPEHFWVGWNGSFFHARTFEFPLKILTSLIQWAEISFLHTMRGLEYNCCPIGL